jgi:hypothetical protein
MKIIALSGKAESGKNFYANLLKNYIECSFNEKVCLIAFADVLKHTAKTYFGWNGEKDEAGRSLLQKVGTELREKNNPDIWTNITCDLIKFMSSEYKWFIVTDVRFERELLTLRMRFTEVYPVRIERFVIDVDSFEDDCYRAMAVIKSYVNHLTNEQQKHSSETELDNYRGWYEIIYNYTSATCNGDVDCSAAEPMYDIFKLINRIRKESTDESI